ncbi:hypothetical protein E1263_17875 [Kribbella antibiotica]|uniref:Secreted protein n=1 Tax=Kribbella antibiotica TaxID=190195 RepID=A0A4R4ZKR3_9ACTN|nr:hypothetical protein [Kribbella antibiotica]TDD58780.1 hypothetical protein E1263_17875 [Kribbella antibiotica]
MSKLVRAVLGIPAAVVLIAVGTTAVANATAGTPSGAPPSGLGVTCVSTAGAKACFGDAADKVWVKDTKANGESAAGTIYNTDSKSDWYRECFNTRGEAGGWVVCDFDVPENREGLLWAVNKPFVGNETSTKIWTTLI